MNNLRFFRVKANLTAQQLAEKAGTTQPQIFRLETGQRKLTKEWAIRLAPHLGVNPKQLLFSDRPSDIDEDILDLLETLDDKQKLSLLNFIKDFYAKKDK
ncbi:helix-turn-helix domain-containing protein [Bartonella sp. DGB1]|uniref:helix-turn-helix domain-containing protein n=1 Tax=Bartonella sp. DGB1 TaxID=3239807 RepID=UPI0035261FDE